MRALKKAGVGTPARTQNRQNESYLKAHWLSNLKLQLGEFLLLLQTPMRACEREICLQAF